MKMILLILFSACALPGFAQSSNLVTEEKSSAWFRVTESAPVAPRPHRAVKKYAPAPRRSAPKENTRQEFEKTNGEVNRFKKPKKG